MTLVHKCFFFFVQGIYHHTLHRFMGFILLCCGQLYALANSFIFDKTPFTLKKKKGSNQSAKKINLPVIANQCIFFLSGDIM